MHVFINIDYLNTINFRVYTLVVRPTAHALMNVVVGIGSSLYVPGAEVVLLTVHVGTMSHVEEEAGGLDANLEENGGTERTSLMVDKEVRSRRGLV